MVDAHPDDEKYIDKLIYDYGTIKVKDYWPWITVPLQIEKERSDVDGNWAEMESCGVLEV
jgi:hypothetical protein